MEQGERQGRWLAGRCGRMRVWRCGGESRRCEGCAGAEVGSGQAGCESGACGVGRWLASVGQAGDGVQAGWGVCGGCESGGVCGCEQGRAWCGAMVLGQAGCESEGEVWWCGAWGRRGVVVWNGDVCGGGLLRVFVCHFGCVGVGGGVRERVDGKINFK